MTLHLIDSSPLAALGLVSLNPLQGALWEMGGTPDEQMQLAQQADQPSTLIKVSNGDQRAILELDLDGSPIVVDNTVSGIGGLDTGVVAADTVYDLRVISNLAGDDYGAIATVSGNAYTPQAGYPWVSPVIGAMVTDGSEDNLALVNRSQRVFMYDAQQLVLTLGTANVAPAAIDLSSFVPKAVSLDLWHWVRNNAVERICRFYTDNGLREATQARAGNVTGTNLEVGNSWLLHPTSIDPAMMVYYKWDAAPIGGMTLFLLGFTLSRE